MPSRTEVLFNLNLQLSAIDDKIAYLLSILEQLAKDTCTVEVSFNMHNEHQHQLNEQEKQTTSIRIINALLDEHKALRAKLIASIEELVIRTMKIELSPLHDNPVHALNEALYK